jgi:hypothetical protein
MNDNECPICLENKAPYYTECCHNYCLDCLIKINKCAICRKKLIRVSLCQDINQYPFVKHNSKRIKRTNENILLNTNITNKSISISNAEFIWICNLFSLF